MYKAPRGTTDILPDDQPYWRFVEETAARLCEGYGYRRIDTPLFETSGLFQRSVGETSDIVEKETYTFDDRSGESMTLRPEGTASICRAYLEHGMHVLPQPLRLYTVRAPMFRYDRPQAGRYRQFHQIDVEAIGDPDAAVDAEIIELALRFFQGLGLTGTKLVLNSIGDRDTRPAYLKALRDYYKPLIDKMGADCARRYDTNVLRLLDCKTEICQEYAVDAPRSIDHLGGDGLVHWESLLGHLARLGIEYEVDHRLVRGLDYYTRTVFEVQPPVEGAQSSMGGGGRYDGLMEELGGRATPAVGLACGIERIILNLKRQEIAPGPLSRDPVIMVAFVGQEAHGAAVKLTSELRQVGLQALPAPAGKSLKAQMRHAGSVGATHTLILGEDEIRQGTVTIKDLATGDQRIVAAHEAASMLRGA